MGLRDKLTKKMNMGFDHSQAEASSNQQSQLHPSNPFYQAPSSQSNEKYQPPPGPPPNQSSNSASSSGYSAPPGPPPGYGNATPASSSGYAPPPGPPPSQPKPSWDPPPYHDWTAIPDTALLPPPPSIGYETSPTANATSDEGGYAYEWCKSNPLWGPQHISPEAHHLIENYQLNLLQPPTYQGRVSPLQRPGHWQCYTDPRCTDSCLLTNLPMYTEMLDSPWKTHQSKTIYFEVKMMGFPKKHGWKSSSESDAGLAVGFVAPPYPTWRLPGWQRGSLAVHGDDGRKYVNNTFGGADFTTAFKVGDVVGIGMKFSQPSQPSENPPAYGQIAPLDIEVFFTRNGSKEGGWDGNQELEEESEGGNVGIRGDCDLFPAVGVYGGIEFEVYFNPELWKYNPF